MGASAVSRVLGAVGVVVFGGLTYIEASGMTGGLHHDTGNGVVETSTILFVQGLLGLPALGTALLAVYRSARVATGTARDGARMATVAVLAIVLFPIWVVYFIMAYGS